MGTSDVLLCPAFKRSDETNVYSDYTCYIEVLSLAPEDPNSFGEYIERWKTFCGELANLWMDMDEKPIPHWAKQWQILEEYSGRDIYEYIREVLYNHFIISVFHDPKTRETVARFSQFEQILQVHWSFQWG